MTTPTDTPPVAAAPDAARNYTFLCLVALLVLLLGLMVALPRAGPMWVLLPVLVGLGGLLLRWSVAPLLFLLTLGGVLYTYGVLRTPPRPGAEPPATAPVTDLVLGVAALAYVAGHYRLQSLLRAVFPHDPRRALVPRGRPGTATPARRPPARVPERRSTGLASPGELVWLLMALPVYGILAVVAYRRLVLPGSPELFGGDPRDLGYEGGDYQALLSVQMLVEAVYRGRLLLWVLGCAVLVVSGLLGYAGWARMSRAEAEVFLQDAVWRETRREQRLLNSWLVWARWRRGRGKENP
jgi:hypothetical protein